MWENTALNNVARVVYGKGLSEAERSNNGDVPVYGSSGEVGRHKYSFVDHPTIILARKGSIGNVFRVKEPSWPIDTVYYLKDIQLDLDYLFYYLQSQKFRNTSTTIPSLRREDLEAIQIKYPKDKSLQTRIVEFIETQFTRLDAAIKSLKVIEDKLSVYRRSILHNAFDGKLVQQSKNEWQIKPIKEICVLVNGRAFKPNEWAKSGLPIIRIQNLNNGLASFNYCDFEVEEKYYVNKGDLLFAWSGTPGTSFGAHIWEGPRAVLNQHIFKVLIDEEKINKKFLMHVLNKNVGQYIQKAHGTAGLAHITKGKFENSEIKIPSKEIQDEVVHDIEFKFSVLDKVDESVDKTLTKANCLRKSILKAAFEGKLI